MDSGEQDSRNSGNSEHIERGSKKFKRKLADTSLSAMEFHKGNAVFDAEMGDIGRAEVQPRSFIEVMQATPKAASFYTGEDDEQLSDFAEELCTGSDSTDGEANAKCPVVQISPEKYHSLFQPWKGALLLKLLGKTVSFRVMEQRTRQLWNLEKGYELIDMEGGYFMARFYDRVDYFHVLEGGPWILMGHYLTVSKWKPNFRPSIENVQSTLVWVRFPELPLELFDEEILYAMGNKIGRTIKIDRTTTTTSRGRYARVCVQINLAQPLLPFLTILGCQQRVEYEGLHLICFKCGKYGHKVEVCSGTSGLDQQGDSAPRQQVVKPQEQTTESGFGPWMLPKTVWRQQARRDLHRRQSVQYPVQPNTNDTLGSGPDEAQVDKGNDSQHHLNGPPVSEPTKENQRAVGVKSGLQAQSRFAILEGLDSEAGWEERLITLKQQLQAIPGPGNQHGEGKAHSKGTHVKGKQKNKAQIGGPISQKVHGKTSVPLSLGLSQPKLFNRKVENTGVAVNNLTVADQLSRQAAEATSIEVGQTTFVGLDRTEMEVEQPPRNL